MPRLHFCAMKKVLYILVFTKIGASKYPREGDIQEGADPCKREGDESAWKVSMQLYIHFCDELNSWTLYKNIYELTKYFSFIGFVHGVSCELPWSRRWRGWPSWTTRRRRGWGGGEAGTADCYSWGRTLVHMSGQEQCDLTSAWPPDVPQVRELNQRQRADFLEGQAKLVQVVNLC